MCPFHQPGTGWSLTPDFREISASMSMAKPTGWPCALTDEKGPEFR